MNPHLLLNAGVSPTGSDRLSAACLLTAIIAPKVMQDIAENALHQKVHGNESGHAAACRVPYNEDPQRGTVLPLQACQKLPEVLTQLLPLAIVQVCMQSIHSQPPEAPMHPPALCGHPCSCLV